MKTLRNIGMGALLALFVFSGTAMAASMGNQGWKEPYGSMPQSSRLISPSSSFMGKLVAVNAADREITVKTFVPGLLGPQEKPVQFRLGKDSTVSFCFTSLKPCYSGLAGSGGLRQLESLNGEMGHVKKDAVVVENPAKPGDVVHVQVTYEDSAM